MAGLETHDNFDKEWADLIKYVGDLQNKLDEKQMRKCLKEIGEAVKKAVRLYAPKRSAHPSYSDFKKGSYKHIMDDIKVTVRKSRSSKMHYVSVHGGKETGYKWLWVSDGHVGPDGKFIAGNKFVEKAEQASEKKVNDIIDKYLKEALKDK